MEDVCYIMKTNICSKETKRKGRSADMGSGSSTGKRYSACTSVTKERSLYEKLHILADAAKYDVACTSSGVRRKGKAGSIGNTSEAGICHSFSADGRCISLLKILLTNECVFDCHYCVNRCSNDVVRTAFTPDEV